jgi:hypothetical protein
VRAVAALLALAVTFAIGIALGQALDDGPSDGPTVTYVRTLQPLPQQPVETSP